MSDSAEIFFKSPQPPLTKGRCEKIDLHTFFVIPAEAGIQYFQAFKNFLDPGFHRGDDQKLIFSHLQGARGDELNWEKEFVWIRGL